MADKQAAEKAPKLRQSAAERAASAEESARLMERQLRRYERARGL